MRAKPDTSPQGFFTYAESYYVSARLLAPEARRTPHGEAPVLTLAFFAIEFYLKALSRCEGRTSYELSQRPFSHDLHSLVSAAGEQLVLTDDDRQLIADPRLAATAIQARYLSPSAPNKLLVEASHLCDVAERIRTAVLAHPSRKGEIVFLGEGASR